MVRVWVFLCVPLMLVYTCVVWLVAWVVGLAWGWGLARSYGLELCHSNSPLDIVWVLVGGVGMGVPSVWPLCWSIACVVWLLA